MSHLRRVAVVLSVVAAFFASATLAAEPGEVNTPTPAPTSEHKHSMDAATTPAAAAAEEADASSGRTAAPPNARVYFISPHDGDTLSNPFVVRFGLSGMGVAPSGVERPATGHFHLLIDVDESLEPDEVIPSDAQHRHFGGGQTQTQLSLPPGKHTLQLLMGDAHHIPHDPVVISRVITVTVVAPSPKVDATPAAAAPGAAAKGGQAEAADDQAVDEDTPAD